MKTIQDCCGHSVRLTDERMAHILEHPDMSRMGAEIERVLSEPQSVRRSRSDDIRALEMQLDTAAAVLYGLVPEEIAIVEGSAK